MRDIQSAPDGRDEPELMEIAKRELRKGIEKGIVPKAFDPDQLDDLEVVWHEVDGVPVAAAHWSILEDNMLEDPDKSEAFIWWIWRSPESYAEKYESVGLMGDIMKEVERQASDACADRITFGTNIDNGSMRFRGMMSGYEERISYWSLDLRKGDRA